MAFFLSKLKGTVLPSLIMGCFMHPVVLFGAEKQTIRIGTYNVENLWDGDPDNTPKVWQGFYDQLSSEEKKQPFAQRSIQYQDYSKAHSNWYEPFVLTAKIKQVIQGITLAGSPDILAIQEIESAGNRSKVWEIPCGQGCTFQSELQKLGYRYFLIGMQNEKEPVAVTTAIISKLPIKNLDPVDIRFETPSTSARDVQVAEAMIGQTRLLIFNGHLKSKAGGNTSERSRIASAVAIKERIDEEKNQNPETRVIVLGDLNSAYQEEPLRAMGASSQKKLFIQTSTDQLYNLWYEKPVKERWETSWNGSNNTLSHMLIDEGFFYDKGLIYEDMSFETVGHKGSAFDALIGADGTPYRWQIRQEFKKSVHLGKGFSDHLPLVANFQYIPFKQGQALTKRQDLTIPRHKENVPPSESLTAPKLCQANEVIDYKRIQIKYVDELVGKCLKISSEEPIPFKMGGLFKSNYITIPFTKSNRDLQSESLGSVNVHLNITMNRSYDWRPNKDDSRISLADIDSLDDNGTYNSTKPHPQSNRCFVRSVLQGKGGALTSATGRIGYINGQLSLFAPSREKSYLQLTDLPVEKETACSW